MFEVVQGTDTSVGEGGLGMSLVVAGFSIGIAEGLGKMVGGGLGVLGVGVVIVVVLARAARRFFFFLSFQRARRSSTDRLVIEGEGVGGSSAGFSIRVEGVGWGVGGVLGVVGAGVIGTGVDGSWVGGWGVGFDSVRLLLGLRCFLVRGLVVVVVEVLEEVLLASVFVSVSLEGGL